MYRVHLVCIYIGHIVPGQDGKLHTRTVDFKRTTLYEILHTLNYSVHYVHPSCNKIILTASLFQ